MCDKKVEIIYMSFLGTRNGTIVIWVSVNGLLIDFITSWDIRDPIRQCIIFYGISNKYE